MYVHIPFVKELSYYSDFNEIKIIDSVVIDNYLITLLKEIEYYTSNDAKLSTIYIGGGTPSMLNLRQLELLLKHLSKFEVEEFTIEVSPENYTKDKGNLFKKYGVNRISLEVISFNEDLLKDLNHKHSNKQVYHTVSHLYDIGINNISFDLIYGISKQETSDLLTDFKHIKNLKIKHISYYSLILEENTYLYNESLKGNYNLISNDLEADMFELIENHLTNMNYEHYEITNFTKDNKYSKHNLLYWNLNNYIGVGLGAHGFIDCYRTYNNNLLASYLKQPLKEKTLQSKEDMIQDSLIFGLRLLKGVNIKELEQKYDFDLFLKYPKLINKLNLGLAEVNNGYLKLTKKGIILGNKVFEVFI